MHTRASAVALAVSALLALAACTGTGSGTANGPPGARISSHPTVLPESSARLPNRRPPAPPIPGAKQGGTLTVLSDFGLSTLDPTEAYYTDAVSILSGLMVRSLTQYVYDPASHAMVLVPDLATDLGRSTDHFKTWRFTLRRGVRFENGKLVTPADLKFGIERSFDRATFPGGADYTNAYFLHGGAYQGPYRSPRGYRGVTVHGRTITLRMSRPFPDMPYWGSFPAMSPIPAGSASDPLTYKNHPLATGPYMVKAITPGQSLTLVKNPYWSAATDPGRHQYVDQFDFNVATTSNEIDATMLADKGTAQTTISMYSVQGAHYAQFSETAGDRLVTGTNQCTYLWFPDNQKITDIDVRRALAYAYPYQAAWTADDDIPGVTRLPASNMDPPGVVGRVPYNPLPGHPPGTTDAAMAKKLLTRSGNLGYPIRFAYPSDNPSAVAVKDVLVRALTAAGFTPTAVATSSAAYGSDFQQNPRAPVNVRAGGWCADWASGGAAIPPVIETPGGDNRGFSFNLGAFSQAAVDDRIAAIQLLPLAQQPAAWNALDKTIQTTYFPVVVTGYGGEAMMRGSRVHNDYVDEIYGMPTWKDLWIG